VPGSNRDVDDCFGTEYLIRGSAKMNVKVPLDPFCGEAT